MSQNAPKPRGCFARLVRWFLIVFGVVVVLVIFANLASNENERLRPELTAGATVAVSATDTPAPTTTPEPTGTPTATPLPTSTEPPTPTPLPTSTPAPTATLDPSIPRTDPESRIACSMSEYFVKERLKSPSTAKFPNVWDELNDDGCTALYNNGIWTLSSWVDSQNSFGAMIRTHYVAQLTYDANEETWHLQDLAFID